MISDSDQWRALTWRRARIRTASRVSPQERQRDPHQSDAQAPKNLFSSQMGPHWPFHNRLHIYTKQKADIQSTSKVCINIMSQMLRRTWWFPASRMSPSLLSSIHLSAQFACLGDRPPACLLTLYLTYVFMHSAPLLHRHLRESTQNMFHIDTPHPLISVEHHVWSLSWTVELSTYLHPAYTPLHIHNHSNCTAKTNRWYAAPHDNESLWWVRNQNLTNLWPLMLSITTTHCQQRNTDHVLLAIGIILNTLPSSKLSWWKQHRTHRMCTLTTHLIFYDRHSHLVNDTLCAQNHTTSDYFRLSLALGSGCAVIDNDVANQSLNSFIHSSFSILYKP